MKINWIKEREPYKAQLIHEVDLISEGKLLVSANKDNPVPGTVTHYGYKKIGNNNVRMCRFHPDAAPDKSWPFSSKWLKRIKN